MVHRYVSSQSLDTLLILFVAYPVGSFGLMKLLQLVFSLLVRKNESYLKGLRTKQTKKIEELKKLTNFSSTEKILSRYDEAQVKKIKPQEKAVVQGKLPQTNEPMSEVHKVNQKLRKDLSMAGQSKSNGVSERLLDWAIGSSNNESIENRFALICKNCYAHNGLAPPNSGDPEGVVFRCWSCSYLNGATEQPPKLTDDVEPEDGGQLTEDGAQIGEEDTSKTAETIEVVSADEDNEPVIFGAKETALEKSKQGKELKSKPREELKSEAVEF